MRIRSLLLYTSSTRTQGKTLDLWICTIRKSGHFGVLETTSIRSFIIYISWKLQNKFSTNSPFWLSNAAMERHRRTWLINSSNPQTSGLDPAYDQRRRHRCRSAVHWQLSTVGDRAFQIVAARTWNALPRHTVATWGPTSSSVHSLDIWNACGVT